MTAVRVAVGMMTDMMVSEIQDTQRNSLESHKSYAKATAFMTAMERTEENRDVSG